MKRYVVKFDLQGQHPCEVAHEQIQEELDVYLAYTSIRFGTFICKLDDAQLERVIAHPRYLNHYLDDLEPAGIKFIAQDLMVAQYGQGLDRMSQKDMPFDNQFRYYATADNLPVYILDEPVRIAHNDFEGRAVAIGTTGASSHGTATASLFVGSVVGSAKKARLFCMNWGSLSFTQTVDWILDNHDPSKTSVVNVSATGGVTLAQVLELYRHNVITVAAAGNFGSFDITWPGGHYLAIGVCGSNANDTHNTSSSHGPAYDIYQRYTNNRASHSNNTGYTNFNGTSGSSPLVAGAFAQLIQQFPHASLEELRWRLMRNSISVIPQEPKRLAQTFVNPKDRSVSPLCYWESHTWTVPFGVYEVTFEGWGAGGTGSGSATSSEGGRGGGGGAYSRVTVPVNPGEVFELEVAPTSDWSSTGDTDGASSRVLKDDVVILEAVGGKAGMLDVGGEGGQLGDCIGDVAFSGSSVGTNQCGGRAAGSIASGEAPVELTGGQPNFTHLTDWACPGGHEGGVGGQLPGNTYTQTPSHEGLFGLAPGGGGSPAIYSASETMLGSDGGQGLIAITYQQSVKSYRSSQGKLKWGPTAEVGDVVYTTDFSEYTIGQSPSDWTSRWDDTRSYIVSEVESNPALVISGGSSSGSPSVFTWDVLDDVPGKEDFEIVYRFSYPTGSDGDGGAALRVGGSLGNHSGYIFSETNNFRFSIKFLDGSLSFLGNQFTPLLMDGTWYIARVRIVGGTFQYKWWLEGDTEPEAWALTVNDSDITTGHIGFYRANNNGDYVVNYFSAAFNGAVAPLPPAGVMATGGDSGQDGAG